MSHDTFRCPRRDEGPELGGNDHWRAGSERWGRGDGDYFPEGFEPPRTCLFCGSIHPEDVLALLARGWEQEKALGKGYKGYLHPPGHSVALHKALANKDPDIDPGERYADVPRDPTPPAKFYTMHFTAPQLAELNAFVRSERKR